MKNINFIIFNSILFVAINCLFVFAADDVQENQLSQPAVTYTAENLRDPFSPVLVEKKVEPNETLVPQAVVPPPDLSKLKVQGIIWGGRIPQAIINSRVLTIGELIEGFRIIAIDKKEVTLSSAGSSFTVSTFDSASVNAPTTSGGL